MRVVRALIVAMAVAVPACQAPPPPAAVSAGSQGAEAGPATPTETAPPDDGGPAVQRAPAPAASEPTAPAHTHHHTAPRGGTLVELGDEFAHLEFVFDAASGRLTAYVLDGEAERAVRIAQDAIVLRLEATGEAIRLEPVAGVLTGETAGDTSQFEAVVPRLDGARQMAGVVEAVTVRGQEFRDLAVRVTAHARQ